MQVEEDIPAAATRHLTEVLATEVEEEALILTVLVEAVVEEVLTTILAVQEAKAATEAMATEVVHQKLAVVVVDKGLVVLTETVTPQEGQEEAENTTLSQALPSVVEAEVVLFGSIALLVEDQVEEAMEEPIVVVVPLQARPTLAQVVEATHALVVNLEDLGWLSLSINISRRSYGLLCKNKKRCG